MKGMGDSKSGAMQRLILRYAGLPEAIKKAQANVEALPFVRVIDTSPRMMLVEVESKAADALREALPQWKVFEEVHISLPPPGPPKLRAG
jgi:hypothetical protein